MSSGLRSLLKSLIWVPFVVAVLIWLGVVASQTVPYSSRMFGYDSANPGGLPLESMDCPLYAYSKVGVQIGIPEPIGQQIVYRTNFTIIPADVSQSFEPVCSPIATDTPPVPARATCFFDIAKLKSADSGAWFLNASAFQNVEGATSLDSIYAGVCLIRTADVFNQDVTVASLVILSGLALVVAGTFLWRHSLAAKVSMGVAVPAIWTVGSVAAGLMLAGNLEWLTFVIGFLLIAATIGLRVLLAVRKKASHDS